MSISKFDEPFIETYFEDYFGEFISDIFVNLKKKNKEYKNIIAEKEKLLNQYPNLRKLIEDDESMALSEEEVSALSKVLCLFDDKRIIQEKELFLRGIREAYFFFKKPKITE